MEQRQFKRVHFFQRVQVESEGKILETYCLDVSLRGILLVLPEHVTWRLEQPLKVTLGLADGENIIMNCFLVHLDEDVVGCACDSMDIDNLTALRRLLEENLEIPSHANRELSELIRTPE
tara:strand:+ start:249 stop:608 length:360 start_codon:yes stop_codon:yes gene_type:complete